MKEIPISPVPSQSFQVVLDGQDCDIEIFTRGDHLYLSLYVDGAPVQLSAICQNIVSVIQIPNNTFQGTLSFVDLLGNRPPEYTGLGTRYILTYWSDGEGYAPVNRFPARSM